MKVFGEDRPQQCHGSVPADARYPRSLILALEALYATRVSKPVVQSLLRESVDEAGGWFHENLHASMAKSSFPLIMYPYSKIWKRPVVMLTTVDLKTVELIISSMRKTLQDRMLSQWPNQRSGSALHTLTACVLRSCIV